MKRLVPAGRLAIAVVESDGVMEVYEATAGFRVQYTHRVWGGQAWDRKTDVVHDTDVPRAIAALLTGKARQVIEDVTDRIGRKLGIVEGG